VVLLFELNIRYKIYKTLYTTLRLMKIKLNSSKNFIIIILL